MKMTNHERIQNAVNRRLDALRTPQFSPISQAPRPSRRRLRPLRKAVALAAVIALAFVCSVSVLAASFPPLQRLFEQAGVQLTSLMQPVELSCVSSDIEMQVMAAVNDDERVTVYLALRDQSGNRINGNTVLSNFQIDGTLGPCDVSMMDFDESTGICIYRLSGYGLDDLDGNPITIEVRTLLNGMENAHKQKTGFPLSSLLEQTPVLKEEVSLNSSAIVYDPNGYSPFHDTTPSLLEPSPLPDGWSEKLPWGTITAAAIVDNAVHIQVKVSELGRYAHADLYLAGLDGEPLTTGSGTFEFGQQYRELDADYSEYIEYVLPLPSQTSLDDLDLYFDAVSYDSAIRGDWNVTFTLDSIRKQQTSECDLWFDSVHYTQATLSPLGISLHGTGQPANGEFPTVEAYDCNGNKIEFYVGSTIFAFEDDQVYSILQQDFRVPVFPENIDRVLVNGQQIDFS